MENITGETTKGYKRKTDTEQLKTMDKYELMKMLHYYCRSIYMYAFMYIDPETMIQEDYFPDTKTFVAKYKRRSTPIIVPKKWIELSYINSKDYELYLNFD